MKSLARSITVAAAIVLGLSALSLSGQGPLGAPQPAYAASLVASPSTVGCNGTSTLTLTSSPSYAGQSVQFIFPNATNPTANGTFLPNPTNLNSAGIATTTYTAPGVGSGTLTIRGQVAGGDSGETTITVNCTNTGTGSLSISASPISGGCHISVTNLALTSGSQVSFSGTGGSFSPNPVTANQGTAATNYFTSVGTSTINANANAGALTGSTTISYPSCLTGSSITGGTLSITATPTSGGCALFVSGISFSGLTTLSFTATGGTVSPSSLSVSSSTVSGATYYPLATNGTITASTSTQTGSVSITQGCVTGAPTTTGALSISASATSGGCTLFVSGVGLIPGTQVSFQASGGYVTPSTATVFSSGSATATFNPSSSSATGTIFVNASGQTGSTSITYPGCVTSGTGSTGTLSVTASPSTVSCNGTSFLTVSGLVAGSPVSFTANLGTISQGSIFASSSGTASTTYSAPSASGTATITASGGGRTGTTSIVVNCGASSATQLTATASPTSVSCNGSSFITVSAKDATGNAVSGAGVTISPSIGTVSPTSVTTSSGGALSVYTAPSNQSGTATITVSSGGVTTSTTIQVNCSSAPTPAPSSPPPAPAPAPVISPPSTGDGGLLGSR